MELPKEGDKVRLHRVRYGQDFSWWENDFEGKEFTVKSVSKDWISMTAYGYGEIPEQDPVDDVDRPYDPKAYGNGAIYVGINEFSRPEMTISRIKGEMGYGRKATDQT